MGTQRTLRRRYASIKLAPVMTVFLLYITMQTEVIFQLQHFLHNVVSLSSMCYISKGNVRLLIFINVNVN